MSVRGLYVEGWNPSIKIVRSRLDPDVWVPRSVLADDITVTEYAGCFDMVRRWSEMTVITMGKYYSHEIANMRWRKVHDNQFILDIRFKEY